MICNIVYTREERYLSYHGDGYSTKKVVVRGIASGKYYELYDVESKEPHCEPTVTKHEIAPIEPLKEIPKEFSKGNIDSGMILLEHPWPDETIIVDLSGYNPDQILRYPLDDDMLNADKRRAVSDEEYTAFLQLCEQERKAKAKKEQEVKENSTR